MHQGGEIGLLCVDFGSLCRVLVFGSCMRTRTASARIFKNSFLRNEGLLQKKPKYVFNIFRCSFTEKFVKSKSEQHLPGSPC